MEKYLLVSDIHGDSTKFEKLLEHWKPEEEILVGLGDYVDRGENTVQVLRKMMELTKQYPSRVIWLKGNHDDMLLKFARNGIANFTSYLFPTLRSMYVEKGESDYRNIIDAHIFINDNYKDELVFLSNLETLKHIGNCIFVHAGINLDKDNFLNTSVDERLWIREEFYDHPRKAPYRVFFGHTQSLTEGLENHIWISDDGSKVCIDGGATYGRVLNGVRVNSEGEILEVISIN